MVPISQRDCGRSMAVLCLWTVVLITTSSKEGGLISQRVQGLNLTLNLLFSSQAFYLSLWETPV